MSEARSPDTERRSLRLPVYVSRMGKSTTSKGQTEPKKGLVKGAIDFASSRAKDILKTMFPVPETDKIRKATAAHEALVKTYLAARSAEKKAADEKEAAGLALCHAVGKDLGLTGDGWELTWDLKAGQIDWQRLAADERISDATIEGYRKKGSRSLHIALAAKGA